MPPLLDRSATAELDRVHDALAAFQAGFCAANGRYWQGLLQPLDAPDYNARTTDYGDSWAGTGITFTSLSNVSMAVDVYDGPDGHGYITRIEATEGPLVWSRTKGVGPDTRREHTWESRDTREG